MDITLPVGSWMHRAGEDSVTWALPGHTDALPYIVIFKRRPMTGETGLYQVKVVRAHKNTVTGAVKNQIMEINFRNVAWQVPADAAAAYDVLQGILADADLEAKATSTSALPFS